MSEVADAHAGDIRQRTPGRRRGRHLPDPIATPPMLPRNSRRENEGLIMCACYSVISFAAASTNPMAQPDDSSRSRISRFSAGNAQT